VRQLRDGEHVDEVEEQLDRPGLDLTGLAQQAPLSLDYGYARILRPRGAPAQSWITDRMFPAGSLNHAISGPSPRLMPFSSCWAMS
jgi:hypothetical protein